MGSKTEGKERKGSKGKRRREEWIYLNVMIPLVNMSQSKFYNLAETLLLPLRGETKKKMDTEQVGEDTFVLSSPPNHCVLKSSQTSSHPL